MEHTSIWSRIRQAVRHTAIEAYCFITAPFVVRNCLAMFGLLSVIFLTTFWWLTCYTNHGESMEVPEYIGQNIRIAIPQAKSRNLRIVVSDSLYVPGKMPGEILDQNPKPKSRVKKGRTLYLTVAKSNPDVVALPDLAGGDDYDLYSRKLSRLGIKTRISARVADPRLEPNTIVAVLLGRDTITPQIRRGMKVEMGTVLDFVVSEKVAENVAIPDCVCETFGAARFLLLAANLKVGTVIADETVTDEEIAFVWRQAPPYDAAGSLRVGESIDLYLSGKRPSFCPEQ
ncbi:MAG: PASTA domain-containing protein [Saprospiraceae bacterium]|nr:PASTA domain-containing protein [Saprospiraceae bacterium]